MNHFKLSPPFTFSQSRAPIIVNNNNSCCNCPESILATSKETKETKMDPILKSPDTKDAPLDIYWKMARPQIDNNKIKVGSYHMPYDASQQTADTNISSHSSRIWSSRTREISYNKSPFSDEKHYKQELHNPGTSSSGTPEYLPQFFEACERAKLSKNQKNIISNMLVNTYELLRKNSSSPKDLNLTLLLKTLEQELIREKRSNTQQRRALEQAKRELDKSGTLVKILRSIILRYHSNFLSFSPSYASSSSLAKSTQHSPVCSSESGNQFEFRSPMPFTVYSKVEYNDTTPIWKQHTMVQNSGVSSSSPSQQISSEHEGQAADSTSCFNDYHIMIKIKEIIFGSLSDMEIISSMNAMSIINYETVFGLLRTLCNEYRILSGLKKEHEQIISCQKCAEGVLKEVCQKVPSYFISVCDLLLNHKEEANFMEQFENCLCSFYSIWNICDNIKSRVGDSVNHLVESNKEMVGQVIKLLLSQAGEALKRDQLILNRAIEEYRKNTETQLKNDLIPLLRMLYTQFQRISKMNANVLLNYTNPALDLFRSISDNNTTFDDKVLLLHIEELSNFQTSSNTTHSMLSLMSPIVSELSTRIDQEQLKASSLTSSLLSEVALKDKEIASLLSKNVVSENSSSTQHVMNTGDNDDFTRRKSGEWLGEEKEDGRTLVHVPIETSQISPLTHNELCLDCTCKDTEITRLRKIEELYLDLQAMEQNHVNEIALLKHNIDTLKSQRNEYEPTIKEPQISFSGKMTRDLEDDGSTAMLVTQVKTGCKTTDVPVYDSEEHCREEATADCFSPIHDMKKECLTLQQRNNHNETANVKEDSALHTNFETKAGSSIDEKDAMVITVDVVSRSVSSSSLGKDNLDPSSIIEPMIQGVSVAYEPPLGCEYSPSIRYNVKESSKEREILDVLRVYEEQDDRKKCANVKELKIQYDNDRGSLHYEIGDRVGNHDADVDKDQVINRLINEKVQLEESNEKLKLENFTLRKQIDDHTLATDLLTRTDKGLLSKLEDIIDVIPEYLKILQSLVEKKKMANEYTCGYERESPAASSHSLDSSCTDEQKCLEFCDILQELSENETVDSSDHMGPVEPSVSSQDESRDTTTTCCRCESQATTEALTHMNFELPASETRDSLNILKNTHKMVKAKDYGIGTPFKALLENYASFVPPEGFPSSNLTTISAFSCKESGESHVITKSSESTSIPASCESTDAYDHEPNEATFQLDVTSDGGTVVTM